MVRNVERMMELGSIDLEVVGNNFNPRETPQIELMKDLQNNVVRFVFRKAKPKDKELTIEVLTKDMMRIAYGTRNPDLIKSMLKENAEKNEKAFDGLEQEEKIQAELNGGYVTYFDLEEREFRTFRYKEKTDVNFDNRLMACEVSPRGAFNGLSWKLFDIENPAWYEIVNFVGKSKEETEEHLYEIGKVALSNYKLKQYQNKLYGKYMNGTSKTATKSNNAFAQEIMNQDMQAETNEDIPEYVKYARSNVDTVKNSQKRYEDEQKRAKATAVRMVKFKEQYTEFLSKMKKDKKVFSEQYKIEFDKLKEEIQPLLEVFEDNKVNESNRNLGILQITFGKDLYVLTPIFMINVSTGKKYLDAKKIFKLGRASVTDVSKVLDEYFTALSSTKEKIDYVLFADPIVYTEDDSKRLANLTGLIQSNPEILKYISADKLNGVVFEFEGVTIGVKPNGIYTLNGKQEMTLILPRISAENFTEFNENLAKKNNLYKYLVNNKGFNPQKAQQFLIELQKVFAQGFNLRRKATNYEVILNIFM